jgi:hypothetical protein
VTSRNRQAESELTVCRLRLGLSFAGAEGGDADAEQADGALRVVSAQ